MASSFGSINTALTSLYAQRRGLDVTGQNIANANTEGYSRQRVVMQSQVGAITPALYATTDGLGTGVAVSDVQRLRDQYLENRARTEHGNSAYLSSQTAAYAQAVASELGLPLEASLGELADAAPAPWSDLLHQHRKAFLTLTAGQRAARETMLAFAGTVETYSAQGKTVSGGVRRPSLVDEAI